jgi:hypothetical protein
MDNENVYWATVRKMDQRWDYLEIAQTSKNRWSVTIDGYDYSVRTSSTDPWDILYAAMKLREKRQLSLQASSSNNAESL